jgi:hypothetical protein
VVDQTVTFLVRDEDFDLALDGIVRWVKPCQNGDGGEYGIEFDTNDMDANILFFMSLRKYLDGFDDVPDEEK